MRENLAAIHNKRATFRGTFVRFGQKRGYQGRVLKTVLLENIRDAKTGAVICDHVWMNLTKSFEALDLEAGDVVEFDGRSKPYIKGYRGYRDDEDLPPIEKDYKLSHPTRVRKVGASAPVEMPSLFQNAGAEL
jgi:hypothetical protein